MTHSQHVSRSRQVLAALICARVGKSVRFAAATFTFDQNRLSIDLSGNMAEVAATGDWPSRVRLPGQFLDRLRRAPPEDDPLPLKVEGQRLFVARFSIPCEWRVDSRPICTPACEMIPANADLFDVLVMAVRCSQAEIDTAGQTVLVSDAQAKLDKLCEKAASLLGAYGVSPLHLRRLCEAHAAEGDRLFRERDLKAVKQIASAGCLLAPMGVEPMEIKALMDDCLRTAWTSPR